MRGIFTLLAVASVSFNAFSVQKPNVLLILADDLGYGDLSCYGGEGRIQTPNCDRLAKEGCRFTQAYTAASVCTPARYSLLTGRYPWRTWLKKGVVGNTPALIDPDTFTMADLFKSAGYKTAAIGKWHIGFGDRGQKDLDWNAELPKGPCDDGFDTFFGMPVSHFYPPYVYIENRHVYNLDPVDPLSLEFQKNGLPKQIGGAAATYKQENAGCELADRACRYIEENSDAPFFLYYAAIEPHTPFTPHPDYHGKSDAGLYGDFVVQFDDGIGRIFQTLEKQGIAENTIVILTSDNGGISSDNGYMRKAGIQYNPNVPLRGDKGDALEGGLRIPFLIRWPGIVKPGTVSDEVLCQTDLLSAFANLLNVPVPEDAAEDSRNILDALKGGAAPNTPIVLQSRAGFHALRQGEWIYLDVEHEGDNNSSGIVETPGQLYRLTDDLHEDSNLYRKYPERVEAMLCELNEIRGTSPEPVGTGAEFSLNPQAPVKRHIGWNDAIWGDPVSVPVHGNDYIFSRKEVWLNALGSYGSFGGDFLTLDGGAALFIRGGGPLGGTLVLDSGQLQNRFSRTAVLMGKIRVDSESKILSISGSLELRTQLSGEGDLVIGAFRESGQSVIFNGSGNEYQGTFVLADAGADDVKLNVEFQKSYPLAGLVFRTANPSRMPLLILKGNMQFQTASLPSETGSPVKLSPGTYDADALKNAGVWPGCLKDFGGSLTVGL